MKKQKGFTLIETLIYIGIFSVVALSLSGILWNTLRISSNQQAANEVDENLRYVLSILNEKVRGSTVIDSATSSTLVLKNGSYEDVIFSVTGGVLYLQEGSGAQVAVTSNKVLVDSLTFTKINMAGAKNGVSVDITLSYNSDKPELAFTKNLISTVNRVAAITFDSDILPNADNLYSVGASNPRWKNGYFSGNLDVGGNLDVDGTFLTLGFQLGSSATSGHVLTTDASGNGTWQASSFPIGTNGQTLRYSTTTNAWVANSLLYNNGTAIGIGTTSPDVKLHVEGSETNTVLGSNATSTIRITNTYSDAFNAGSELQFEGPNGAGTDILGVIRTAYNAYSVNGLGGDMFFGTKAADANPVQTRMTILSTGNVGIGATSPGEKLEVTGNIKLSGATPTYKITNVAVPTVSSDVATKGYVDGLPQSSVAFRYKYNGACPAVTGVTLRVAWYWDDLNQVNTAGTDCGSRKTCVCYYSSL